MTPESELAIERVTDDGADVFRTRGELDLTNAGSLQEALLGTSAKTVILDLSGLDYIDSAGMRALDQSHRGLGDNGRRLLIVATADSRAAWTLRVAGFADGVVLDSLELARHRAGQDPRG